MKTYLLKTLLFTALLCFVFKVYSNHSSITTHSNQPFNCFIETNNEMTNGLEKYSLTSDYNTLNASKNNYIFFYKIEEINDSLPVNVELKLYPNPASDIMYLQNNFDDYKGIIFEIVDIKGTIINGGEITNNNQEINIKKLADDIYFLKIFVNRKHLKTFKLIKISRG
ncbi:MAG: T9SS type A sorting domain-containing protein [Bacteroidota bacterium]|nr:T9SS type A sorting domain-containing protein [Bacteroidota bacterium]